MYSLPSWQREESYCGIFKTESGHRLKVYTAAHSMEAEARETPGSLAGPEPHIQYLRAQSQGQTPSTGPHSKTSPSTEATLHLFLLRVGGSSLLTAGLSPSHSQA